MKKTRYILVFLGVAWVAYAALAGNAPCRPQSFGQLARLSDQELESVDIARMNLLCAEGLPGSGNLDVDRCLEKLDRWAEHVLLMERKYAPAYQRNRSKYGNSLALFKGVYLGIAIEQDFNCGYNQGLLDSGAMDDRGSTRFFRDSSDVFINGLIGSGKGSCSSLPVLMVALGRRCNYPLYLVGCGGHAFTRWDDGSERVNLEITCQGVNTYSDEHYKEWPRPIDDEEIEQEHLLRNYTGKEMLGVFSSLRAACLKEHKRYEEAKQCYEVALGCFPRSRLLRLCMEDMDRKIKTQELKP